MLASKSKYHANTKFKLLIISHDANLGGAQILLLTLLEWMASQPGVEVYVGALTGGNILERFKKIAPLLVLDETLPHNATREQTDDVIKQFCMGTPDVVLLNSVASSSLHRLADLPGVPRITFVHEMEHVLRNLGEDAWNLVKDFSSLLLAASQAVYDNLLLRGMAAADMRVTHDYIREHISEEALSNFGPQADPVIRASRRKKMGLSEDGILVFGCGTIDWRKGTDLFCETAAILRKRGYDQFHFYWIGILSGPDSDCILADYKSGPYADSVVFLGFQEEPRDCMLAGDIFFLSSREDPFALAALEGAECGLPVLCFAGSGGIADLVSQNAIGCLARDFSPHNAADACVELLDSDVRKELGRAGRDLVRNKYTVRQTGPQILHFCREACGQAPVVSVLVPNYNHARYLPARLDSILSQTIQNIEILVLDDASTDNSLDVLAEYAHIPYLHILKNDHNKGVFGQWRKGFEHAKAEIIWIAEADDDSDSTFLEKLLPMFNNPEVVLANCASRVVDAHGIDHGFEYRNTPYMTSLSPDRWYTEYIINGYDEVVFGMGSRNTIFNVSSTLFRRQPAHILDDSLEFKFCGDWIFYLNILQYGSIAYTPEALNIHRRHDESNGERVKKDFSALIYEFFRVHSYVITHYSPPIQVFNTIKNFMFTIILPMFPEKTQSDLILHYDFTYIEKQFIS